MKKMKADALTLKAEERAKLAHELIVSHFIRTSNNKAQQLINSYSIIHLSPDSNQPQDTNAILFNGSI